MLAAAASGERIDLSPGDQLIDLSHVNDVANAFLCAGKYLLGRTDPAWDIAFVPGERRTLKQWVEVIRTGLGRPLHVNFGGRDYRDREIMAPIEPEASAALAGWRPRRRFVEELPSLMNPDLAVGEAIRP